jgi:hypothetical protein
MSQIRSSRTGFLSFGCSAANFSLFGDKTFPLQALLRSRVNWGQPLRLTPSELSVPVTKLRAQDPLNSSRTLADAGMRCRIDENGCIEQTGYSWNAQSLILGRNRTRHVVEIVRGN